MVSSGAKNRYIVRTGTNIQLVFNIEMCMGGGGGLWAECKKKINIAYSKAC
jgi:hypothetical protein